MAGLNVRGRRCCTRYYRLFADFFRYPLISLEETTFRPIFSSFLQVVILLVVILQNGKHIRTQLVIARRMSIRMICFGSVYAILENFGYSTPTTYSSHLATKNCRFRGFQGCRKLS